MIDGGNFSAYRLDPPLGWQWTAHRAVADVVDPADEVGRLPRHRRHVHRRGRVEAGLGQLRVQRRVWRVHLLSP